jgi:hypothetical protein
MFRIKFQTNDKGPAGKLADCELHFSANAGPLAGLKLVGFSVWQRRSTNGYNVTVPARQYAVNGERRSFALLRPIMDATAADNLRDIIIDAWRQQQRDDEPTITPNVEPTRSAPVPTTYEEKIFDLSTFAQPGKPQPTPQAPPLPGTAPLGLFSAPDPLANVERYDDPNAAAAAAKAGKPINIMDLIGPTTSPAVRADIRHEQQIRERLTTTARPRPGFTPAGDPINF